MEPYLCEECGQPLDTNIVFCPHCGAAIFQRNTPASQESPAAPPLSPDTAEISHQTVAKKSDRKILIFPVIAALAVMLVLFLIWEPFSPAADPQVPITPEPQIPIPPSTEQTAPSTTSPKIYIDPAATASPTSQPTQTEPPETEPLPTLPGEPLTQEQLQKYANELSINGFFNCATTTVFSHPKEINLHQLFYNGISWELDVLTDEERTHFSAMVHMDVHILSPDNMNEVLTNYFGITFEETDKRGLDKLQYWDKTGNYYWFGTDANGNWDIEVLAGSTLSDGSIQILYRSTYAGQDVDLVNESNLWIITFSPEEKVFSNLPA